MEKILIELGAVSRTDPRMRREAAHTEAVPSKIRQSRTNTNGDGADDSDWD